jgi:hypothetical protein
MLSVILFVSEYGQVQVSCEKDNEQRSTPSGYYVVQTGK